MLSTLPRSTAVAFEKQTISTPANNSYATYSPYNTMCSYYKKHMLTLNNSKTNLICNSKHTTGPTLAIGHGIDNGRFILADIHHASTAATTEAGPTSSSPSSPPITTILNIYGRSHLHSDRAAFYTSLLEIPVIFDTLHQETSPVLIMGDFNYSYEQHQRADGSLTSAPEAWVSLLARHLLVHY
ncbi:hypothetical protein [Parasitella parasitica]|uniref:Endonuclease/exonuclease/phosphatase domain-containing protein n=1 Tax=Parasitella parasitica TaxID=35722 RepID=A0A0B7N0N8_9FUNG|nr:hypothetical protein [Parasitella parasitica]